MLKDHLEKIYSYAEQHTTPETKNLYELNRKTNLEVAIPQMISGHLQGAFLKFMSQTIRPKYILEIGTYTSYSAICMASGLQEGGKLISIDNNKYLEDIQREFIAKENLTDSIELHLGDAQAIIPNLDYVFDLAFIDADKINYANYYDLIIDKMPAGATIIADNVLYEMEVLTPETASKNGKALADFNKKIQDDARVENMLLPLRDGLMLIRKL
jgi:predicted O-methyltransferase YrrM